MQYKSSEHTLISMLVLFHVAWEVLFLHEVTSLVSMPSIRKWQSSYAKILVNKTAKLNEQCIVIL